MVYPHILLFEICLFVALVALVARPFGSEREKPQRLPLIRALIVGGCLLGAVIFWPGLLPVQQALTALVLPAGLAWFGLLVAAYFSARAGKYLLVFFICVPLAILTVAGNGWVSCGLIALNEWPYRDIDPMAVVEKQPLDAIITLGGSTSLTPAGQAQVVGGGDRVMLAARLYYLGAAPILITTGEPKPVVLGPDRHPAGETKRIWLDLGIPEDAILLWPGRTTLDEMSLLAAEAEAKGWKNIGVVTSAQHMARAERLAAAQGLSIVPLPAYFRGDIPHTKQVHLIPTGSSLQRSGTALKERFARIVGR